VSAIAKIFFDKKNGVGYRKKALGGDDSEGLTYTQSPRRVMTMETLLAHPTANDKTPKTLTAKGIKWGVQREPGKPLRVYVLLVKPSAPKADK
jgi:hypothetical protein